jgi:F420-non-reducing hydrogenase small subunit
MAVAERPKVVFYSCGGCEECEAAALDFLRQASDLKERLEIIWWPHYQKLGKRNRKKPASDPFLLAIVNGPAATGEQEENIRYLRRNSRSVIAYGSCANVGIPGLVNEFEAVLKRLREDTPENDRAAALSLAGVLDSHLRTPDEIVTIDHYLPGCPPNSKLLKQAILSAAAGKMPAQGKVIGPGLTLCAHCPRLATRPASGAKQTPENWRGLSPDTCFLALGVDCMGPVVKGGCDAKCIEENRPCTGCFGPNFQTREQTAKIFEAFSAVRNHSLEMDIEKFLVDIPDPLRSFYRYRLLAALLRRRNNQPT